MEDPLPANIAGEKRVAHTVEHRINWGYVALAAAAIVVLLYLRPSGDGLDDELTEPAGEAVTGLSS